ncbi:MAG: tetratricopeptide repeat protein [Rhodocyclaceae bacterium]|nr:tetratricopeptide repeat protein [Rhodocyclaceae bacterium]
MDATQFDEALRSVEKSLSNGAPHEAAHALRRVAAYRGLDRNDAGLRRLCDALLAIAGQMTLTPLQSAAETARSLKPQALYDLGYLLIELGLPQVAIPILGRLNRDLPGQSAVVEELAAAFERSGLHAQARDLLLANPALLAHFWHRYILCFNALSAADIGVAIEHAAALHPADAAQAHAMTRMRTMLDRVRQVDSDLSPNDLRGWHFVMNGSVLLHLSPYGFDEGMHGRYCYLVDTAEAIHRDLTRLATALNATGARPNLLRAPDDRGSQIVAGALGRLLEVPVVALDGGRGGMIVTYDPARATPESLTCIEEDRSATLMSRAACWTQPPRRIPEFVGLLHQVLIAPWDAQTTYQPDGTAQLRPASAEPEAHWIERIVQAADHTPASPDVCDPISSVIHLARLKASPPDHWSDGPVTSNRFA